MLSYLEFLIGYLSYDKRFANCITAKWLTELWAPPATLISSHSKLTAQLNAFTLMGSQTRSLEQDEWTHKYSIYTIIYLDRILMVTSAQVQSKSMIEQEAYVLGHVREALVGKVRELRDLCE